MITTLNTTPNQAGIKFYPYFLVYFYFTELDFYLSKGVVSSFGLLTSTPFYLRSFILASIFISSLFIFEYFANVLGLFNSYIVLSIYFFLASNYISSAIYLFYYGSFCYGAVFWTSLWSDVLGFFKFLMNLWNIHSKIMITSPDRFIIAVYELIK